MILPRYALLIPFAALAACGGGTIRVADDGSSTNSGPVSLAPTPDSEPAPSVAAAPAPAAEPARDSTAVAAEPSEQGYAGYGDNGTLELKRIGKWSRTGIGESRRLVIRDANAWAEFWAELGTGDRPNVDFTKAIVVAVAAGQRPSGGYEIAVDRVGQVDGELTVQVLETSPSPNCTTSSSPTQPVDVVVVPVVALKSWSFLERKETRACR
jgi:microcompartment protein CcmK/EutM